MRAANQIYARKGGVQYAAADTVSPSVFSDPSRPELVEVHMAVLKLRQARDLNITGPANQLKRANCALQPQVAQIGAIYGTDRANRPTAFQIAPFGCLQVRTLSHHSPRMTDPASPAPKRHSSDTHHSAHPLRTGQSTPRTAHFGHLDSDQTARVL